jgi:hypothetical protein
MFRTGVCMGMIISDISVDNTLVWGRMRQCAIPHVCSISIYIICSLQPLLDQSWYLELVSLQFEACNLKHLNSKKIPQSILHLSKGGIENAHCAVSSVSSELLQPFWGGLSDPIPSLMGHAGNQVQDHISIHSLGDNMGTFFSLYPI